MRDRPICRDRNCCISTVAHSSLPPISHGQCQCVLLRPGGGGGGAGAGGTDCHKLRVHCVRSEHSTAEQGIPGESSQTNINI